MFPLKNPKLGLPDFTVLYAEYRMVSTGRWRITVTIDAHGSSEKFTGDTTDSVFIDSLPYIEDFQKRYEMLYMEICNQVDVDIIEWLENL